MNDKVTKPHKAQCKKWILSFRDKEEYDQLRNDSTFLSEIETEDSISTNEVFYSIWKVTFKRKLYETEVRSRVKLTICKINPAVTYSHQKKESL